MFFYQISRIFSRFFLIISWYDFIIFDFIIIFSMTLAQIVYIKSKCVQNQVVYYFRKSIYRQFRALLD